MTKYINKNTENIIGICFAVQFIFIVGSYLYMLYQLSNK